MKLNFCEASIWSCVKPFICFFGREKGHRRLGMSMFFVCIGTWLGSARDFNARMRKPVRNAPARVSSVAMVLWEL